MKNGLIPAKNPLPSHPQRKATERAFQVRRKLYERTAAFIDNSKELAKIPKH